MHGANIAMVLDRTVMAVILPDRLVQALLKSDLAIFIEGYGDSALPTQLFYAGNWQNFW
jgi:hypothetical protein